ncbi:MAG: TonB-dependent receptor [Arenicella sp.]|nr:TonB-dependent receptor [Arenicella sp.]
MKPKRTLRQTNSVDAQPLHRLNRIASAIRSGCRAATFVGASAVLASASVCAQSAEEQAEEQSSGHVLEQIIVTATRRAVSQQDVAVTLQTFSEQKLENLRVDDLQDYLDLLPGVDGSGSGPGKSEVSIRGVSPGRVAVRLAGIASEPSVGYYLGEAPIATGGRNIDIYTTDINRIEVLKGPQGTLFGASSQGGAIRLIPNKPVFNEFEGRVNFGYATTTNGDPSTDVDAVINIPLIEDKLAARIAVYSATQGGYIDNIAATAQIPLDQPTVLASGNVPQSRVIADNASVAEDDFNSADYSGIRASLSYQINDNWDIYVQHLDQSIETQGIFEYDPAISANNDLKVVSFVPDEGNDEVSLTSWSVTGRFGELEVIYNGSYTDREFDGITEYTGYSFIGYAANYVCSGDFSECFSPVQFTDEFFQTNRINHEVRIQTDSSKRLRVTAGVYYDDQETIERTNFVAVDGLLAGVALNAPIAGAPATDPNVRASGVYFFNDFLRNREEISYFADATFDITDRLSFSFGARHYAIDVNLSGQSSFATRDVLDANGNLVDGDAGNAVTPPTETFSDTVFKSTISYNATDDALLYFSYAEGFRPGNFNRNGSLVTGVPFSFDTDVVENYELGYKTEWLNNTLRINGAFFFVDFTDIQQSFLDLDISNSTFTANVGAAEIKGAEVETEWLASDALTVFASATYLDAEVTDAPPTLSGSAGVGEDIAYAPTFQGVAGFRYEKPYKDFTWFAQGVLQHIGDRVNNLALNQRFDVAGYTQSDLSFGISKDNWRGQFYIENVGDKQGELDRIDESNTVRTVPIRPRTVGFKFSVDF